MSDLDLRNYELTLDSVHQAIQYQYIETLQYPHTVIITPKQEATLLAEWKAIPCVGDTVPESLNDETLWGQRVIVKA